MFGELRPCPFCGGKPHMTSYSEGGVTIGCKICGAASGMRGSASQAEDAWNARSAPRSGPEVSEFDSVREEIKRINKVLYRNALPGELYKVQSWH